MAEGSVRQPSFNAADAFHGGEAAHVTSKGENWRRCFIAARRKMLDNSASIVARACRDGSTCRNFRIEDRFDAIEVAAPGVEPGRVILYFHGGAFSIFSVWTHRGLLGRLSEATQATIVAANYRLAPLYPFPAALDDAMSSWRWVCTNHATASIAVAGDSAGGGLCFSLLIKLAQLGEAQPMACIALAPWLLLDYDMVAEGRRAKEGERASPTAEGAGRKRSRFREKRRAVFETVWDRGARKCAEAYAQGHPTTDPLVSPFLADDSHIKLFPPVLVHADEDEPLAYEAKGMVDRCSQAGVRAELKLYKGTGHVFQTNPILFRKEAKDSLACIGEFLSTLWSAPDAPAN